ncbi:putative thioredoxin-like protein [Rosa chinensis]|uniref:Putative thioredoxin-like protein n=1 Tax=Rosa chinensis TaxID=74649 RepID=A0A2P6RGM4_ROSCH|nr:uncharacterized protein LOC112191636 isoform X1 [Rosa chinensis]PRQ45572.1 putative thioredoxin-like protein [Rosa chinensis]
MARNLRVQQSLLVVRKLLPGSRPLALIPTSQSSPLAVQKKSSPLALQIYRPLSTISGHVAHDEASVPVDSLIRFLPLTSSYTAQYDYILKAIRDDCLNVVCCFYAGSPPMHLPLIVQAFVERFPHVKIYHFLIFTLRQNNDTYEAAMRMLNVTRTPLFHFFRNGKKVDQLVGESIVLLDKTLKNLYNIRELDTQAKEVADHKGAVGWSESKVSASLE